MLMNYVLSFCRITSSSKIFSRSFYLPLLKPLTPREAFRTFRITGKWLLGVKHQRYIPVLMNHRRRRSKKLKNYGKLRHKVNDEYMYMAPVLDPENEQHKQLLEGKLEKNDEEKAFVYAVDDRMYQLVLSPKLESAIRKGDVIDVLISHVDDKILVKLKNMKKITLEIATYDGEGNLYKGEGATTEEDEKFHHYGKETMTKAKQFEDKEKCQEEWENELLKIEGKRKKHRAEGTVAWKKMMKVAKEGVDWDKFEEEAKTLVDHILEPATEANIIMDLHNTETNLNAVDRIAKSGEEIVKQLPSISEIPDVVRNMFTGVPHELETKDPEPLPNGFAPKPNEKKRRVSGVKVKLSTGQERFVTGQMVATEDGDMFVPGQTVRNANGTEYEPGIIINMANQPSIVNGLILGEEEKLPVFVPADTMITSDGQLTFAMSAEERPKLKRRKILRGTVDEPKRANAQVVTLPRKMPMQAKLLGTIDEYVPEIFVLDENENIEKDVIVENRVNEMLTAKDDESTDEELLESDVSVAEFDAEKPAEDLELRKDALLNGSKEIEEKITLNDLIATIETMQDMEKEQKDSANKMNGIDYEYELQKRLKDNMDGLLSELEQKKLDLVEKLEALHKLSMIPDDESVTFIDVHTATKIAEQISKDDKHLHKMADILLTMTRRANTYPHKDKINKENVQNPAIRTANSYVTAADEKFTSSKEHLKVALKTAMIAGVDVFKTRPKDQITALHTIGGELQAALMESDEEKDVLVEELCQLMSERNEMCTVILKALAQVVNENKVEVLKSIVLQSEDHVVANKILQIFDREDDLMGPAFKRLSKNNGFAVGKLQEFVRRDAGVVKTEHGATEALQRVIVSTVREVAQDNLARIATGRDKSDQLELIGEAIGFATALGLAETAANLRAMKSTPDLNILSGDSATLDILKRVTVIRQLAGNKYERSALKDVQSDPETARSDPRVREMVRDSAALTTDVSPIESSKEIPLTLLQSQNFLAIEDFLVKRAQMDHPILISRGGVQAVVPREAARGVLSGKVAYTLIDESGLTRFKPKHVFAALKLDKGREKQLENYRCVGAHERFLTKTDNRAAIRGKIRAAKKSFSSYSTPASKLVNGFDVRNSNKICSRTLA